MHGVAPEGEVSPEGWGLYGAELDTGEAATGGLAGAMLTAGGDAAEGAAMGLDGRMGAAGVDCTGGGDWGFGGTTPTEPDADPRGGMGGELRGPVAPGPWVGAVLLALQATLEVGALADGTAIADGGTGVVVAFGANTPPLLDPADGTTKPVACVKGGFCAAFCGDGPLGGTSVGGDGGSSFPAPAPIFVIEAQPGPFTLASVAGAPVCTESPGSGKIRSVFSGASHCLSYRFATNMSGSFSRTDMSPPPPVTTRGAQFLENGSDSSAI